ncbi:MAG: peptidase and DD-carboxypeptidase VanY/endolysin [Frankiales bacterium]|nr:peptidase and DD-carboxypeptidase VanY/endolysin [Frankiales bacterium]MCW2584750.1 peptidase and DD-carboxypeptidase VanY/endolysin [Frankiales bacterium]
MTRPARLLGAGLLATVITLGALALPSPAQADQVGSAQARVDGLQRVARETTAKLTDGTRRWESDQARLRQLELDLANTRRRISQTQAQVEVQQRQVDSIGRQLAMGPAPSGLRRALTSGPEQALEALRAQQSLNISAGSQAEVIARAQTAKHRLRDQERSATRLVADAADLTRASARRLAELTALADRTAAQLTQAQNSLSKALADRAAAQARASREKAARERASRSRVSFSGGGGATCTGKSTSGQANGNLDPASLCPLWSAGGHRLRADAAAAFNKLSQYRAATTGAPLCVTDSYRSYGEQVSVYHRKPGLAAVPGTSNHGWGLAADLCGGVQSFGTEAYGWMKANAGRFGWFHPDWAEPSGSKPEAWHWEFNG